MTLITKIDGYRQREGKRTPSGLTRKEYMKRWRSENKEYLRNYAREYYPDYSKRNEEKLILGRVKSQAKIKKVPFNLKLEDIVIPECCPVLGMKLERNFGGRGNSPSSPSVDRIVPSKGYVVGNIIIMSQQANVMKNNATLEELERFADWVKNELRPLLMT